MPTGMTGVSMDDGDVGSLIYWDATFVPGADQTPYDAPLIDGPRGFCMDNWNISGANRTVSVTDATGGTVFSVRFGKGNPITTGQARSRTRAQMAALGYTKRSHIDGVTIG